MIRLQKKSRNPQGENSSFFDRHFEAFGRTEAAIRTTLSLIALELCFQAARRICDGEDRGIDNIAAYLMVLELGFSLRDAASLFGVAHTTIKARIEWVENRIEKFDEAKLDEISLRFADLRGKIGEMLASDVK